MKLNVENENEKNMTFSTQWYCGIKCSLAAQIRSKFLKGETGEGGPWEESCEVKVLGRGRR